MKTKIVKNPSRGIQNPPKPYIPQYREMGIEPEDFEPLKLPQKVLISTKEKKAKSPPSRQPYAEAKTPFKGGIPNTGNNMEHSWVEGNKEIIDDLELDFPDYKSDPSHKLIDNNDFLSVEEDELVDFSEDDNSEMEELEFNSLNEGNYALLIQGTLFFVGTSEEIEEHINSLIFNDKNPISPDDIMVLKRMPIKIGVFLGEL